MSLYNFVDHRAPKIFQKDAFSDMEMFFFNMILLFAGVPIGFPLIAAGLWWVCLIIAVPVIIGECYLRSIIHSIPDTPGLDDHRINSAIRFMQQEYKKHPDPDLEKILISAYDRARAGDAKGVEARKELMTEYISTIPDRPDPEIADFKAIISIRQEMKQEGLL